MRVFTAGLAKTSVPLTLSSLYRPPTRSSFPGLVHAECLTPMELGTATLSPKRTQFRKVVMFAAWESEDAVDHFLKKSRLGQAIEEGWHVRMSFLRRWGSVREFASLPESTGESDPQDTVAAFTLARMRLPEIPRFIRWGRPVEVLVRDNPHALLSLAAIRYPNTVATFSIWDTQQAMIDMVRGHTPGPLSQVHIDAMEERERRDFHHEFTTLRFRILSEYGSWKGQSGISKTG
ncbi:hypothetical protein EON81_05880 [bacterium]|nr:MAG: hypothetical protein EON81_05880 [bacterium]